MGTQVTFDDCNLNDILMIVAIRKRKYIKENMHITELL